MPYDGATAYDKLQNQISEEARLAEHYIADRTDSFKSNVSQVIGAIQLASREYDNILKAKASKSLFGEIFVNLIITLLPAANLIKGGASLFTVGAKAQKVVGLVNDKYIDLIKNFKDPIDQAKDAAENQTKEQNQISASNDAIRKELTDLFELNNKIDELARNSRKFIRMKVKEFQEGTDKNITLLAKIRSDFTAAGLDTIKKVGAQEFNTLTENLLYDMLRKYVETYFVVKIGDNSSALYRMGAFGNSDKDNQSRLDFPALRTKDVFDLPEYRAESLIEGLDNAQRNAIYAKFGTKSLYQAFTHADHSRPSVNGYRSLIYFWKAKTISAYTNKPIVFKVNV